MIYLNKPKGFNVQFEGVGCLVFSQGEMLMLLRANGCLEAGRWWIPGGRANPGESAMDAVLRELKEETGIVVAPGQLRIVSHLYVFWEHYKVGSLCHTFSLEFPWQPEICLSHEHIAKLWIRPSALNSLRILREGRQFFRKACGIKVPQVVE